MPNKPAKTRFPISDHRSPLTILGIDPGIADTGYGVISRDGKGVLRSVTYGTIRTKAGLPLSERLFQLHRELADLIKRYKPQLIGVEQLYFAKNVRTALTVGQARGVIMLTACQVGVDVAEYTPLQVKQAVSTYGQASKLQVQRMVKILLKLDELPKPDDAADALAVAICAANSTQIT